jgi:hypothetical protein
MLGYVGYLRATGAVETRQAVVSCPTCTYLEDGTCVVCVSPDDHPACDGCRNGQVIWYRRPLFVSVVMAVTVSLIAGLAVSQIKKRTDFFD